MDIFLNIIIGIHILLAISICIFVLLQHGKGADLGAAFGSGASGSIFGSQGAGNFLSRTTALLVALFFITSIGLTYISAKRYSGTSGSVIDQLTPAGSQETVPSEVPMTPAKPALPADVPQANGETPAPAVVDAPSKQASDVPQAQKKTAPETAKAAAKPETKPVSKP